MRSGLLSIARIRRQATLTSTFSRGQSTSRLPSVAVGRCFPTHRAFLINSSTRCQGAHRKHPTRLFSLTALTHHNNSSEHPTSILGLLLSHPQLLEDYQPQHACHHLHHSRKHAKRWPPFKAIAIARRWPHWLPS